MNVFISLYGALITAKSSTLRLLFSPTNLCKVASFSILNWTPPRSSLRLVASPCSQHCKTYGSKVKKSSSLVQLAEGEKDVINLEKIEEGMAAAINSLKHSYTTSVVTRITPTSLDKISVEVEGQSYPLRKIAQLGMPNPQTIVINMSAYPESVNEVAVAVREADLGLNPLVEKNLIKIPIPKVTGELRESLTKLAKFHAEKAKKRVRNAREKGITDLRKQKSTSTETTNRLGKYVQQLADNHTATIDDMTKAKITELTKAS